MLPGLLRAREIGLARGLKSCVSPRGWQPLQRALRPIRVQRKRMGAGDRQVRRRCGRRKGGGARKEIRRRLPAFVTEMRVGERNLCIIGVKAGGLCRGVARAFHILAPAQGQRVGEQAACRIMRRLPREGHIAALQC